MTDWSMEEWTTLDAGSRGFRTRGVLRRDRRPRGLAAAAARAWRGAAVPGAGHRGQAGAPAGDAWHHDPAEEAPAAVRLAAARIDAALGHGLVAAMVLLGLVLCWHAA